MCKYFLYIFMINTVIIFSVRWKILHKYKSKSKNSELISSLLIFENKTYSVKVWGKKLYSVVHVVLFEKIW